VRKPPTVKLFSVADPAHPRLVAVLPGLLNADIFRPAIELWDVSSPAKPRLEVQWANPSGDDVATLAFSPRGHVLAVVGNNDVTLWDTNPGQVAGFLCATAGDPISRADWLRYVPHVPYQPPCAGPAGR
jgi:hypothetical protein